MGFERKELEARGFEIHAGVADLRLRSDAYAHYNAGNGVFLAMKVCGDTYVPHAVRDADNRCYSEPELDDFFGDVDQFSLNEMLDYVSENAKSRV